MANIDTVIDRHFNRGDFAHNSAGSILSDLDLGLYNAANIVVGLRMQVLHGSPSVAASEQLNSEELAAQLEALLAFLAQLGGMVDRLGECDFQAPGQHRPQAVAA